MKLKFNPLDILNHRTELAALVTIDPRLPTIKVNPTLSTSKASLDVPSKTDAITTADVTKEAPASLITYIPLSSRDTNDDEPTSPLREGTRHSTDDKEEETTTRPRTAKSDDDESPRTTQTVNQEDTTTSKAPSRTPTIDSLIPTTLMTRTPTSDSFDYPYPTSMPKSIENSTTTPKNNLSELEKTKASLQTYKIHYRNMIIALTIFALLVIGFVAFKIWWTCIRTKKKVATIGVETILEGGRGWFGALKKGKEVYDMHKAKKAGSAPGGADYI